MAKEMLNSACEVSLFIFVRFFSMPYIYDTGPTALLPLPNEVVLWIFIALKNPIVPLHLTVEEARLSEVK
jgi:hypothetical protein